MEIMTEDLIVSKNWIKKILQKSPSQTALDEQISRYRMAHLEVANFWNEVDKRCILRVQFFKDRAKVYWS